tara:strand:- start:95 stop:220 length:126 start_codon:yes stop_codon:yes gene_type:complete
MRLIDDILMFLLGAMIYMVLRVWCELAAWAYLTYLVKQINI